MQGFSHLKCAIFQLVAEDKGSIPCFREVLNAMRRLKLEDLNTLVDNYKNTDSKSMLMTF